MEWYIAIPWWAQMLIGFMAGYTVTNIGIFIYEMITD